MTDTGTDRPRLFSRRAYAVIAAIPIDTAEA
jgi:hypothetical protein